MTFHYTVVTTAETEAGRDAFLAWLVNGHVAEVVAAGALTGEIILRDDGLIVEGRYTFASRAAFADYERDHAPRLRAERSALFPHGLSFQRATGTAVPHRASPLS